MSSPWRVVAASTGAELQLLSRADIRSEKLEEGARPLLFVLSFEKSK